MNFNRSCFRNNWPVLIYCVYISNITKNKKKSRNNGFAGNAFAKKYKTQLAITEICIEALWCFRKTVAPIEFISIIKS